MVKSVIYYKFYKTFSTKNIDRALQTGLNPHFEFLYF